MTIDEANEKLDDIDNELGSYSCIDQGGITLDGCYPEEFLMEIVKILKETER